MFQAEQLPQANTWRYKITLAGSWTLNIVGVKEVVENETDIIGCNAKMEPFIANPMFEFHWGNPICLVKKNVTNEEHRRDA